MTPDFRDLTYLRDGSEIQREGYAVIQKSEAMTILEQYGPVLAGTLPLNLFTIGSDLDILCEVHNPDSFEYALRYFSTQKNFALSKRTINGVASIVCSWEQFGFLFEVFGQPIPVAQQNGFRHMTIEFEILQCKGNAFREKVMALKNQGIKTEPAFAQVLMLSGNPYEALLTLDVNSLPCV